MKFIFHHSIIWKYLVREKLLYFTLKVKCCKHKFIDNVSLYFPLTAILAYCIVHIFQTLLLEAWFDWSTSMAATGCQYECSKPNSKWKGTLSVFSFYFSFHMAATAYFMVSQIGPIAPLLLLGDTFRLIRDTIKLTLANCLK